MHFDSILHRARSTAMLLTLLIVCFLGMLATVQALLIPPHMTQEDVDALQHYNEHIEALHEQSGGYHQRFKSALAFQDGSDSQRVFHDDSDDNVREDGKNKGGKGRKHPKDGDGDDKGKIKLVPVVLGVMSKCPDAEICESVFDKTLGQVSDLVDLKTVYIGRLNETMRPYGVECMHGSQECDGNVQQLCVRESSKTTQRDWWNFIQCQNFQDLKRVGDISLAKQCAKVIKKDWDADFESCYTGSQGAELLRESVLEAKHKNITKSCSIIINDKLVCVHDGSWKNCTSGHEASDFEKYIKKEYEALNGKK